MAKQRIEGIQDGDNVTAGQCTGIAINEAPVALADERYKLLVKVAEINEKLNAGREPELNRLKLEVATFNTIFGANFVVTEEHLAAEIGRASCRERV